ncbi:putative N-acetylgalactosaminyltransferase 7 [Apostichopus japonicus]|uniref:Putative N-acetylgalactosaminyltransferase 7 n=1 Tax=Stichopus japonicus TaxID=307972 RepID=A0A2G8JJ09_STIJA|nr:putative N-acetylgalactosaminyltransferase 7 [Apostichopus japonicus]
MKHLGIVFAVLGYGHLQQPLEDYIREPKFLGKVLLHRNAKREGLIRTRIIGAQHATGEVLLWLDAHCEPGYNWLPPLLAPIAANRTTAVCPLVDVIGNMDFGLHPQGSGALSRGGFDWSLFWKHFPLPDFEKKRRLHETEPYSSPAMAGGLFAMSREFFFELGAYDEGLEIWGGENFELSFKNPVPPHPVKDLSSA